MSTVLYRYLSYLRLFKIFIIFKIYIQALCVIFIFIYDIFQFVYIHFIYKSYSQIKLKLKTVVFGQNRDFASSWGVGEVWVIEVVSITVAKNLKYSL